MALLEYTANVSIEDIPRALSITILEIPETKIFEIPVNQLPGDWTYSPAPSSTKELGSVLLKANQFPIIKLPTAIVPDEFNFLLNPRHVHSTDFKILAAKDFIYDVRLKLK